MSEGDTRAEARSAVDPTTTDAWAALERDAVRIESTSLRELFAASPDRVEAMSLETCGIHADLSKNLFDQEVIEHLVQLAAETGVVERRDAMFAGAEINTSERRSVLHVALRMPRSSHLEVDGADVVAEVHAVLDKMASFCAAIHEGRWRGATGERITHVLNIGIGGSYLGPEMAAKALRRSASTHIEARFVANVDGADFEIATVGSTRPPRW